MSEKSYWNDYVSLDLEVSDKNKISRPEKGGRARNEKYCKSVSQTQGVFEALGYGKVESGKVR